jgi:hypothetical protein
MPARPTSRRTTSDHQAAFEAIADGIMYRWSVERDTWVSSAEVEEVRAYLARQGINTTLLPDGQYSVESDGARTVGRAHLVHLALKHLHAARRERRLTS